MRSKKRSGAPSGRSRRLPYNNATSRVLHRIPPPAEAKGFQTAGLTAEIISGLKEKERVVAYPEDSISDGTKIQARK